jgi:hypothetical protein
MADEAKNSISPKVVALLKKNIDTPTSELIKKSGIPPSQIGRHIYAAEPIAKPSLKFKGTPAAIVRARDVEKLRWERIAARTGMTVSEVREAYEEKSGQSYQKSYIDRGRRWDGTAPAKGKKAAGKKGTGRATSGRRAAANGRKKSTAKKGTKRPKARTRADLKAKAGSPS